MINKEKKKLILFPPKTGSTSFESCFKQPLYGYDFIGKTPMRSSAHMYIGEAIDFYEIEDIENYKIYQTARDPMNRVPSAFMHQKTMATKRGKLMKDINFEDFVKNLVENNDLLPMRKLSARTKGSRLYLPQTTWADPEKYEVQYLKVEKDNSEIYAEMGLPEDFKIPHKNRGNFRNSNYEHLHTNKTREIIRFLYEDDFIKLNYK